MTQAQADGFNMVDHPDAPAENGASAVKLDRTHLNARGQAVFGRMVADALVRTQAELRPDLVDEAAGKSAVPNF